MMKRSRGIVNYEVLSPEAEARVRSNLSKEVEFYEHVKQRLARQLSDL